MAGLSGLRALGRVALCHTHTHTTLRHTHTHTSPRLPPPAPAPDKLDGVVHVDLLKRLSADRIRDVWLEHHMNTADTFADILSAEQYAKILHRGYECPMFAMPLRTHGGSGYLTLLCQFQTKHVLFTPLEHYRRDVTAAPWFSVTLFDEFAKDEARRLCLVRGTVAQVGRISKGDADTTWRQLRKLYTHEGDYAALVQPFNRGDPAFHFDKVLHRLGVRV